MLTDGQGTILEVIITGANAHDSTQLAPLLDKWEGLRPGNEHGEHAGRPRKRFEKLYSDKGYDIPRCRKDVMRRGMKVRIARKGVESKQRLGLTRWKVERSMSWFNGYRKLRIRDERSSVLWLSFHSLAAALMCFRRLTQVRGF